MRSSTHNKQSGVALYISILVAALILAVGLSIGNIYVKETNLSISSRESQIAFYAADSGLECAQYWDKIVGGSYFASTSDPRVPPVYPNQLDQFTCAGFTFVQPNTVFDPTTPSFPANGIVNIPEPTENPNVLIHTVYTPYSAIISPIPVNHPVQQGLDSLTLFKVFFDLEGNGATASDPCAVLSIRKALAAVDDDDPDIGGSGLTTGVALCIRPTVPNGLVDCGFYHNTIIESRGYNTCDLNSTRRVERAIRVQ